MKDEELINILRKWGRAENWEWAGTIRGEILVEAADRLQELTKERIVPIDFSGNVTKPGAYSTAKDIVGDMPTLSKITAILGKLSFWTDELEGAHSKEREAWSMDYTKLRERFDNKANYYDSELSALWSKVNAHDRNMDEVIATANDFEALVKRYNDLSHRVSMLEKLLEPLR